MNAPFLKGNPEVERLFEAIRYFQSRGAYNKKHI